MPESRQEISSISGLPKVDRTTIDNLISAKGSFAVQDRSFVDQYPSLIEYIYEGFPALSEEQQQEFLAGMNFTFLLLKDSQPRTGGTIPQEVSLDVINATTKSFQERVEKTGIGEREVMIELFDDNPQIFLALNLIANKLNWSPTVMVQAGHLLLKIFNLSLDSKKLEKNLGF